MRHSRLRFSQDLRVKEVARLLRSSRAMRLRMSAEASEADFERSKQVRDVQTLSCCFAYAPAV